MHTKKHILRLLMLMLTLNFIVVSCNTTKKSTKSSKANNSKSGQSTKPANTKAEKHSDKSTTAIKNKYAEILEVKPNELNNIKLYEFIDEWYGVPYKYGGRSKTGVDCSNLTTLIYNHIYQKQISGSSASLFNLCKIIKISELKEGDLVFFKIEQTKISHIGLYLHNNKFVHATTKRGVMINDLDEAYYKKYFYKAGRIQ